MQTAKRAMKLGARRGAVGLICTPHLARMIVRNCTVLEMGQKLKVVSKCRSRSGLTESAATKEDLGYSLRYLNWLERMFILRRASIADM